MLTLTTISPEFWVSCFSNLSSCPFLFHFPELSFSKAQVWFCPLLLKIPLLLLVAQIHNLKLFTVASMALHNLTSAFSVLISQYRLCTLTSSGFWSISYLYCPTYCSICLGCQLSDPLPNHSVALTPAPPSKLDLAIISTGELSLTPSILTPPGLG